MKQTSVFRVSAEICFYFSLLNVFSAFLPWRLPMAFFAAACLLLGFAIVRLRSAPARYALSLLPALLFLMGPLSPLLFFPALASLYYVLVMGRGHYAMPVYEYRKNFTVMLVVSLFFLAANVANSTIYRGKLISVDGMLYAFAFLILGVTAMRRMQMGAEMNAGWKIRNALTVVGLPVLAVGLSLLLFLALRFTQSGLRLILIPLGRLLLWLLARLFPGRNSPLREMSLPEAMFPKHANTQLEVEVGSDTAAIETPHGGFNPYLVERAAAIGGWVLLGLLLLLAIVLVVRHARRNAARAEDELTYEETQGYSQEKQPRRRRVLSIAGNARQLRRIYRTYLEYRRAHGLSLGPTDTSAEILARDQDMSGREDAARLRELYIAARYGDPSAITREQVTEAQACLERILA